MTGDKGSGPRIWALPPLILHPFSNATDPVRLLANSRANEIAPTDPARSSIAAGALQRKLMLSRYCEIRMLWCIGKDLARWIEQCLDFVGRQPELRVQELRFQSFSMLLVENTPAAAVEKLKNWGVTDYRSIFARALGLNTIFAEMPSLGMLSDEFLRDYYTFTYQLYVARQRGAKFVRLDPAEWLFDVYTSGEYIKIIENQMTGR